MTRREIQLNDGLGFLDIWIRYAGWFGPYIDYDYRDLTTAIVNINKYAVTDLVVVINEL